MQRESAKDKREAGKQAGRHRYTWSGVGRLRCWSAVLETLERNVFLDPLPLPGAIRIRRPKRKAIRYAKSSYAIYGRSVMSAKMLEVSILGVGMVLRLDRDALSMVK